LTIDGTSLNYESSADIYGWQFNHDGCAQGASGGDSGDAGLLFQHHQVWYWHFLFQAALFRLEAARLLTWVVNAPL